MQKLKGNLFLEKFSLLNSQEHTEDIKWSLSSSSDYENTSCNDKLCNNNKNLNRKRKRKKKVPKNTSNLDITIVDAAKDHKKDSCREKSPVLVMKCGESPISPILLSKFPPKSSSPILPLKSLHQKSPILMQKNTSPKYSIKVKKQLNYNDKQTLREPDDCDKNVERILYSNFITPDKGKDCESQVDKNFNKSIKKREIESNDTSLEISRADDKWGLLSSLKSSDKSESSLNAKLKLINNVKRYFDSHFSSENTSQNISDTPTPEESLKNDAIDILSCVSIKQTNKHDSTTSNSDTSNYFEKNKKVKYKKGGLAYRLSVLLKKQNAHVSLWQHERFLAGTSNFIIPKGEHAVFCIQKIDFKYGCYLLDAVDANNEKYVIFINSSYVNNNIIPESVLKLYEPYKTLEFEDKNYQIIINVCKFECFDLKNR